MMLNFMTKNYILNRWMFSISHKDIGIFSGCWLYSSIFYVSTGFHGMQIVMGTVALIVCFISNYFYHFTKMFLVECICKLFSSLIIFLKEKIELFNVYFLNVSMIIFNILLAIKSEDPSSDTSDSTIFWKSVLVVTVVVGVAILIWYFTQSDGGMFRVDSSDVIDAVATVVPNVPTSLTPLDLAFSNPDVFVNFLSHTDINNAMHLMQLSNSVNPHMLMSMSDESLMFFNELKFFVSVYYDMHL